MWERRWPRGGKSPSRLWCGERSSKAKEVAAAWVRRADQRDTRADVVALHLNAGRPVPKGFQLEHLTKASGQRTQQSYFVLNPCGTTSCYQFELTIIGCIASFGVVCGHLYRRFNLKNSTPIQGYGWNADFVSRLRRAIVATNVKSFVTMPGEDFLRARRRVDLQETLSFRPVRQPPHSRPEPYDRPDTSHDGLRDLPSDSDEALFGQVFTVEDVDPSQLPDGWSIHADGCCYLTSSPRDYLEIRAGCLLRHHVIPRRHLFRISDVGDAPIPYENLDFVRATLVQHPNGGQQVFNDDGLYNGCPIATRWTGITIFQIKGETRKELGMTAHCNPRQVAKDQKVKNIRAYKKEKDKNSVSERTLDLQQRELFQAAKVKELKSFFENGVWEFQSTRKADPARTLSSRMLLKWAKNPDGTPRAKARLIVRGYSDIDALEGRVQTDSPTTSRLSRSLFLSISALCKWNGWTADVATAFLEGLPQERQLWVKLPADALNILGADSECRMLLKKPCYGQLDAPRRWFLEATRRLKQLGLRQHCLDPCLFMLYETDFPDEPATSPNLVVGPDRLCGLICIHVDDLLGTGCPDSVAYQKLEVRLKEAFNFREWHDTEAMEYCGASLVQNDEGWKLSHENYYKKFKPITVDKNRGLDEPLNAKDTTQLRGLLGSLQWPAVQSSPHLQASASLLAGQVSSGTVETMNEANRLLRFAKGNSDVCLEYQAIGPLDDLRLVCSFDAAFGVRRDGASQGGLYHDAGSQRSFRRRRTSLPCGGLAVCQTTSNCPEQPFCGGPGCRSGSGCCGSSLCALGPHFGSSKTLG